MTCRSAASTDSRTGWKYAPLVAEASAERIEQLDLSLFDPIESQSTANDRRSLLACQRATRHLRPDGYRYLEIGSHRGGSIQPHLLDSACTAITSIDKRSDRQDDERGVKFAYQDNTTQRMLDLLGSVAPLDKLTTIDGTTTTLDPVRAGDPVHLCFIDGEHTDATATSDFDFCLSALDTDGAIVFHDAAIIYRAIEACLAKVADRSPAAYVLPDQVFVIELGDFALHDDPHIRDALLQNHSAYLFGLQFNDHYRQFANRPAFQAARALANRVRSLKPNR